MKRFLLLIALTGAIHAADMEQHRAEEYHKHEADLVAQITHISAEIKRLALDATLFEILITKLEQLNQCFQDSCAESDALEHLIHAIRDLKDMLPTIRNNHQVVQERYFMICQLAVIAAQSSSTHHDIGKHMQTLFMRINEVISNLHEKDFKSDYSERYKTVHVGAVRTYATYVVPWMRKRVAFEKQAAIKSFSYLQLLHEHELDKNKMDQAIDEQLRLLESQLSKQRIPIGESSSFDPSLANGSGSYMMGNIAHAMMAQPFKEPRLLETAAVGTAAGYALPVLKFAVIGGGISFIIYKLHKWLSSDTSLESLKTKMEVMIARLDKDMKKANNHNFEAMKQMLKAHEDRVNRLQTEMENRFKAREREMQAQHHRVQGDAEKMKADIAAYMAQVRGERRLFLEEHEKLVKGIDALIAGFDTATQAAIKEKLKKDLKKQKEDLAKALNKDHLAKKTVLDRFRGCFSTPEPGQ